MRFPLCVLNADFITTLPVINRGTRYAIIVSFFCLFTFPLSTIAQSGCPVPKIRKYTSGQRTEGVLGDVLNPINAIDGAPATYSTLNVLALLGLTYARQYLNFDATIAAGTPVSVKIIYPVNLVGVGTAVTVQPFIYDSHHVEKPAGVASSVGDLLSLISGSGDMEITLTPKDGAGNPVAFDGVWITLSGVLSVGASMGIYDAWIQQDAPGSINCNNPVDVLAGIRAGGISLLNATGSVDNKWLAIDDDPGLTTYAQLNTGVQVLSEVFETVVFSTPSKAGDSIYIVLQDPGSGLLDLSLLTGFTIQPYLGKTAIGSPITNTGSLLSLRLLSGPGRKYVLSAAIPAAFDRIDIKMGGLLGALSAMRIYDVRMVKPVPSFSLNLDGIPNAGPICIRDVGRLKFTITSPDACATYNWYKADNTLLLANSLSFTPVITAAGTYTYYVEAIRTGCNGNVKNRVPVTVTAVPRPGAPVLTIQLNP